MTTENKRFTFPSDELPQFRQFVAENNLSSIPELEQQNIYLEQRTNELSGNTMPKVTGTGSGEDIIKSQNESLLRRLSTLKGTIREGGPTVGAQLAERGPLPGTRALPFVDAAERARKAGADPADQIKAAFIASLTRSPISVPEGVVESAPAPTRPIIRGVEGAFSPAGIGLGFGIGGVAGRIAAGGGRAAPIARFLADSPKNIVAGEIGGGIASEAAAQAGLPLPLQIAAGFAGGVGGVAAPRLTGTVLREGQQAATSAVRAAGANIPDAASVRSAVDRVSPFGTAAAKGLDEGDIDVLFSYTTSKGSAQDIRHQELAAQFKKDRSGFDVSEPTGDGYRVVSKDGEKVFDFYEGDAPSGFTASAGVADSGLPRDPLPPEDLAIIRRQIDQDILNEIDRTVPRQAQEAVQPAAAKGTVISLPKTADDVARQAAATEGVTEKLTQLIRGFRRLNPEMRASLERARNRELGRRAAIGASRAGRVTPENRAAAIASAQGGQLPSLGQFESVRGAFDDSEFRVLHQQVADTFPPNELFTERRVHESLNKLLVGSVPTEAELRDLERVFGPEFRRAVEEITKTRGRKAWEQFISVMGLPRGILASFDISAVFRQGGVLTVAHPAKAFYGRNSAFARMIRSMASKEFAQESINRIRSDPDAKLLQDAKWFIRDPFETNPLHREEIFISKFLRRIPGVAASERGFSAYLNEITHKTAKSYINGLRREGLSDEAIRPGLEKMARFLNISTGRGELGVLERSKLLREIATVGFWSPRLLTSRIQTPIEGLRALRNINAEDPAIREASRQIAGDLVKYTGGMLGFLTILDISGLAEVETDPRSSDFGKIRVGNTRLDSWAGFQQPARYIAQLITGQSKSAATGKVTDTRDRADTLGRFIRSKLAPGPVAVGASALPNFGGITGGGKNFIGESISFRDQRDASAAFEVGSLGRAEESNALVTELVNQITPLMTQDIQEALKEQGLTGAMLSSANLVGVGSTSFDEPGGGRSSTPTQSPAPVNNIQDRFRR